VFKPTGRWYQKNSEPKKKLAIALIHISTLATLAGRQKVLATKLILSWDTKNWKTGYAWIPATSLWPPTATWTKVSAPPVFVVSGRFENGNQHNRVPALRFYPAWNFKPQKAVKFADNRV